VTGSWRFVVVNVIQASVQETSSSFNDILLFVGGSFVSQEIIVKRNKRRRK